MRRLSMISKPLLAETLKDLSQVQFPCFASAKLDGIRCLVIDGKAVTRAFKPIPNKYVREWIEANVPSHLDGELMLNSGDFSDVQSAIMSADGEPDFFYAVFDYGEDLSLPFIERLLKLRGITAKIDSPKLRLIDHFLIDDAEHLLSFEAECLKAGHEGIMIRSPSGKYKCGRSTLKEGILLKLKRFTDSEAEIIGFEELLSNQNEAEKDAFGRTKRSASKEGKVPAGTLGKFLVRDVHSGVEFEIGTGCGLTQELRKKIWDSRDSYRGKFLKYKYFSVGVKEKPRFPVMLGFRDKIDM